MKSKLQSTVLDDLCEQIVDSEHKTAPTQPFGIPYIRTPNVKNTRLILDDAFRVSEEIYIEWTKRLEPQPYDIVLCREAPVGDSGMVLPNQKICLGQRTTLIRPNHEKIYPKYLLFLLNSPSIQHKLLSNSGGTHVDHLNMKDIRNLNIKIIHSYDEQKVIGDILFNLNSKIYSIENQNKILEQIIQTIFKSWFIDFDGITEFDDSELGKIPKGWKIEKLSSLGTIITGKTPPTKEKDNFGEDYPFITIPDMQNYIWIIKTERSISEKAKIKIKNHLLPKNSVCVSCIATPGLVSLTTQNSFTNQQINSIVCNEDISPFFIFQTMNFKKEHIIRLASGGTATLNLNKGDFSLIKIILPPIKIIKKFHDLFLSIFETIKKNYLMIDRLIETRDTLLPKLISGEIRL